MKLTSAQRVKKWREENPEKIKAYIERTKEKRSKYGKKYREENKGKVKKIFKRYYKKNKERKLEYQNEYNNKNMSKIKENQAKYKKENPDRVKGILDKAHDKRNFGGLRIVVLKRDKYKCIECGISEKDHKLKHKCSLIVHHIDGVGRYSKKPNNDERNLQTLCKKCHSSIHGKQGKKRTPLI